MPTVRAEGHGLIAALLNSGLGLASRFTGSGLDAEALLAAADRAAGRIDDQPEQIALPLSLLLADLADHPVTPLGEMMLRTTLHQALVSRRRLQALPEPSRPRLPPIVIVGWYRTGTTYLQALLSALPGYRHVPLHRLVDPALPGGARARTAIGVALQRQIMPEFSQLHPISADGPEECWLLLATHLLLDGLSFHLPLPRFEAWLEWVDRRPAYRTWARAVALLAGEAGHGLVMKDPAHIRALSVLHNVTPEARLIWTHREPAACIASFASLTAVQHRAFTGRLDRARAGQTTLRRFAQDMQRAELDAQDIPRDRLALLDYAWLEAAPVEAIAGLCAQLDLRFDEAAIAKRAKALAKPRRRHETDLALWGLDEEQVRLAINYDY